jgi:hypothetical protein
MERDSSARSLAGTRVPGSGGQGDVSLDAAIPKYVAQQLQHQQQQQPLLANALRAEAEIFYSCESRDLSFLHGAHEPYHLGDSGDFLMTKVCLSPPRPQKPQTPDIFCDAAHAPFRHRRCRRRRRVSLLRRAPRCACDAHRRSCQLCQRWQAGAHV